MTPTDRPPSCAWCDAAHSLTLVASDGLLAVYECSCCSRRTIIPARDADDPATDIHGLLIDEDA